MNPVARHAGRFGRQAWGWSVPLLFLGAAGLGLLLQHFWMEMGIYTSLQPAALARWLGLTLIAETAVALPWAAVRGALLWRRLRLDGHLDEYRRSHLGPRQIVTGAAQAALAPVGLMLALSLAVSLAGSLLTRQVSLVSVLTAHALLAVQVLAFGALGLWLGARFRYPAAAIPLAVASLAAACGAIMLVDPHLRRLPKPEGWIYAALLPNPITAVGNALDSDVLRFAWLYAHVHAHEYFFVYPPAWQTGLLYLGAAALLFTATGRRLARMET